MQPSYKPDGYSSVAVYIMADGAEQVIDFVKQAFGAEELRRQNNPDGSVMHAEVRIDDTVVMLADAGGNFPAFPAWLHVYVPDVDAIYRRALDAGGTSVQEPMQQGEPDRLAGVQDPAGNTWWIATQVGGAEVAE